MSDSDIETVGVPNGKAPSIRSTRSPTFAQILQSTRHKLKEHVSYIFDHHSKPTEARTEITDDGGATYKEADSDDYTSDAYSSDGELQTPRTRLKVVGQIVVCGLPMADPVLTMREVCLSHGNLDAPHVLLKLRQDIKAVTPPETPNQRVAI